MPAACSRLKSLCTTNGKTSSNRAAIIEIGRILDGDCAPLHDNAQLAQAISSDNLFAVSADLVILASGCMLPDLQKFSEIFVIGDTFNQKKKSWIGIRTDFDVAMLPGEIRNTM